MLCSTTLGQKGQACFPFRLIYRRTVLCYSIGATSTTYGRREGGPHREKRNDAHQESATSSGSVLLVATHRREGHPATSDQGTSGLPPAAPLLCPASASFAPDLRFRYVNHVHKRITCVYRVKPRHTDKRRFLLVNTALTAILGVLDPASSTGCCTEDRVGTDQDSGLKICCPADRQLSNSICCDANTDSTPGGCCPSGERFDCFYHFPSGGCCPADQYIEGTGCCDSDKTYIDHSDKQA